MIVLRVSFQRGRPDPVLVLAGLGSGLGSGLDMDVLWSQCLNVDGSLGVISGHSNVPRVRMRCQGCKAALH